MSEAQSRHIFVLEGKLLEVLDNLGQLGENEVQGTLLEDQVGIVGDCEMRQMRLRSCEDADAGLTIAAGSLWKVRGGS